METIGRLKERIEQGYRLGYDEALELLRTTPETELCALAHALRTRYQGKTIDMCSIMNARSGRCSEDCKHPPTRKDAAYGPYKYFHIQETKTGQVPLQNRAYENL